MPWSDWQDPVEVQLDYTQTSHRLSYELTGERHVWGPPSDALNHSLVAELQDEFTSVEGNILHGAEETGLFSDGGWRIKSNVDYQGWPMNQNEQTLVTGHTTNLTTHPTFSGYGVAPYDAWTPNLDRPDPPSYDAMLPIVRPTPESLSKYTFLEKLLPNYAELTLGVDYGTTRFPDGYMRTIQYESATFVPVSYRVAFDFGAGSDMAGPVGMTVAGKIIDAFGGGMLSPGEGDVLWAGAAELGGTAAAIEVFDDSLPAGFLGYQITAFVDPSTMYPKPYLNWGVQNWTGSCGWSLRLAEAGATYRFITPRFRYWIPAGDVPLEVSLPNGDWVRVFGDGRARLRTAQGWAYETQGAGKPLLMWDGAEWVEVARMAPE